MKLKQKAPLIQIASKIVLIIIWMFVSETRVDEGNLAPFPARKAFLQDPYFQNNPNYKYAIDVFAPIAKTIAAQKGGRFPELNEVDGDAAFSTLIQQL